MGQHNDEKINPRNFRLIESWAASQVANTAEVREMAYPISVRRVASVSIVSALVALVGIAFSKEMLNEPKVWPYAEMQWTKDAVLPSVQGVLLWGDPKTTEHGMLRRFPAGDEAGGGSHR